MALRVSESDGQVEFVSSLSEVESDVETAVTRNGTLRRPNHTEKM